MSPEDMQRSAVIVSAFVDGQGAYVTLRDARCETHIAEYEDDGGGPAISLAELVQRAGEHTEVCP